MRLNQKQTQRADCERLLFVSAWWRGLEGDPAAEALRFTVGAFDEGAENTEWRRFVLAWLRATERGLQPAKG